MRNTGALTGRMTSAQTLMQTLGYSVLVLRIAALPCGPDSLPAQLQFLSALLARHGVTHSVPTDQAAASVPQDFTVRQKRKPRPALRPPAGQAAMPPVLHNGPGPASSSSGTSWEQGAAVNQQPDNVGRPMQAQREAGSAWMDSSQPQYSNSRRPGFSPQSQGPSPRSQRMNRTRDSAGPSGRASGQRTSQWQPRAAAPAGDQGAASGDAWGRVDSTGDAWGRVDSAASDPASGGGGSDQWQGWGARPADMQDDASASNTSPSRSRSSSPSVSTSRSRNNDIRSQAAARRSSMQQRSATKSGAGSGEQPGKGGLRRTRKSFDLPALSKSSQQSDSETSGSWNEW